MSILKFTSFDLYYPLLSFSIFCSLKLKKSISFRKCFKLTFALKVSRSFPSTGVFLVEAIQKNLGELPSLSLGGLFINLFIKGQNGAARDPRRGRRPQSWRFHFAHQRTNCLSLRPKRRGKDHKYHRFLPSPRFRKVISKPKICAYFTDRLGPWDVHANQKEESFLREQKTVD